MTAPADTTHLVGGPIWRYGGKGRNAPLLVPHFARAEMYAEPFFGGGSIFWRVRPGTYRREAINDLDDSVMTFFRVLRDRTEELVLRCALTPYSRTEFAACLPRAADELEEARRVWVRGRQGFAGKARSPGDWGRSTPYEWVAGRAESKLGELALYAARLRQVAIDCVDGLEFIEKWGQDGAFLYADPPYVPATRAPGRGDYAHEMTTEDHARLLAALRGAAARGAKVAVSGYPSALYDAGLAGWRKAEFSVPLSGTRDAAGQRRAEVLWMSYGEREEIGWAPPQLALPGTEAPGG